MTETPTINATDFIRLGLEKGMKPAEIRAVLRKQGIAWSFSYTGHCGERARLRYLRQQHRCECGATAPKHRWPYICDTCLERKWAE